MPGCNMNGFPSRIDSYAEARKHFDSVKPWNSKYNPGGEERPIGTRSIKTDCGYHNPRFNKAMRERSDGSIVYRLYEQDCVIWHPDNTLTVHGHPTVSTSAFVNSLVPADIAHGKGAKDDDAPVLHLRAPRPDVSHLPWEQQYPHYRTYWNSGVIINCSRPVTLNYNVASQTWHPAEPNALEPFTCYRVDRKAAREVSRRYHLSTLDKVVNAVAALSGRPAMTYGTTHMGEIMDALKDEQYMTAIELMPRGGKRVFGRWCTTPSGIEPGFLQRLRSHIYDHEGVVERFEVTMLTPSQYRRCIADEKRFG